MAFTKVVGAGIHTLSNITSHNINSSGIITATKFVGPFDGTSGAFSGNVSIGGSLTVNGDFTTLNTTLREVETLYADANSSTAAGIITQRGSGNILDLYDTGTAIFSVRDGGNIIMGTGAGSVAPHAPLHIRTGTTGAITTLLKLHGPFTSNTGSEGTAIDFGTASDTSTGARIIGSREAAGAKGALRFCTGRESDAGFNDGHMVIDETGKVGIGTGDPEEALHIQSGSPVIKFSDGVLDSQIRADAADLKFISGGTSKDFMFQSSVLETSEVVRITGDGKVGIGTDNPTYPLEVWNSDARIRLIDTDLTTNRSVQLRNNGGSALLTSATHTSFYTGGYERIRIKSTGQVGIGTDSPTEKLTVLGNILVKQFAETEAKIQINETTTTNPLTLKQTATESLIQTGASQPLNIRAQAGSGSNSYLAFWTRNDERLRIAPNGSVGIGTTNPKRTLHVNDTVGEGIAVNGATSGIQFGLVSMAGASYNAILSRVGTDDQYVTGTEAGDLCLAPEKEGAFILGLSPHLGAMNVGLRIDRLRNYEVYFNSQIKINTGSPASPSEKVRIKSDGNVSIGSSTDGLRRLDVVGNSLLVRPTIDNISSSGNASAVNNSIIIRMPYGENPSSTNHAGARFGIQFTGANNTTDVPSLNWGDDPTKSASIYGVSEDNLGFNRKVGLVFYTSNFDAAQTERLRITSAGRVGIGTNNPTRKLQIGGSEVDSYNVIRLGRRIASTNTNLPLIGHHSSDGTGSGLALCATSSSGAIHFFTGNGGNGFGANDNQERVVIKHDGKVGIGTNDPSSLLTVGGDANPTLELKDYTNNARAYITAGSNGQLVFTTDVADTAANSDFVFRADSNTNEIVRFKGDNGKVGIGTQNPVQNLHVNGNVLIDGDSASTASLDVDNKENLGNSAGDEQLLLNLRGNVLNDGQLRFRNIRLSNGTDWTTSAFRIQRRIDVTNMGYIDFGTGSGGGGRDIQFGSGNGTMYMHLDNDGKVGIGSAIPASKLDVHNSTPSDTGGILVQNVNYANNQNKPYLIIGSQNWTGGTDNWGTYGLQHRIKTNSGGSPRVTIDSANGELFCVENNGRIGIGTDSPTDVLDINSDQSSAVSDVYIRNHANLGGAALNLWTQGTYTSPTYKAIVGCSDAGGNIRMGAASNHPLLLLVNNAPKVTIQTSGQVDINGNMQFTVGNPELEFNNGGPRFRVPAANTLAVHSGGTLGSTNNEQLRITSGVVQLNAASNTHIRGGVYAKYTGASGNTADINTSTIGKVSWLQTNTEIFENGGFSNDATDVTVPFDGIYMVMFNGYLESANIRTNVRFRFQVNGTDQDHDLSLNNYIRRDSGHNESSVNFTAYLNLSANDTVAVSAQQIGSTGTVVLVKNLSSLTFHLVA